jgi:hypothetical protein
MTFRRAALELEPVRESVASVPSVFRLGPNEGVSELLVMSERSGARPSSCPHRRPGCVQSQ